MNKDPKKISKFKKFSDLSNTDIDSNESENYDLDNLDEYIPGNPNLPKESKKKMIPVSNSKNIKPKFDDDDDNEDDNEDIDENKKVEFFGKVAKLPNNTLASKGYSFLESVKISKNTIWYIMIEKQDNELQMVKYNFKKGVDLNSFVNELKSYYTVKYKNNKPILEKISNIHVEGNDKFSIIKNIPAISINGKKLISQLTNDLIVLLSK